MKIIGTGLSGLVGSRTVELLGGTHTFVNYSLETGVDITNRDDMLSRIQSEKDASWMLHFAAYTNVQQAEIDRDTAWKVNVAATKNIVDACRSKDLPLLYVDTDYAFDGKKKEGYTEEDHPNPLGWYAKTKTEGAKCVLAYEKGLVIRIANPYRSNPIGKTDFVHKMLERLTSKQEIIAPSDQLFVPTFIDDIAVAIDKLVTAEKIGMYHVVGSQALSPFSAAKIIAKTFKLDELLVKPAIFSEYFAGRAPIPQFANLTNSKIRSLGVLMRGFSDGLIEMKRQEQSVIYR